MADKKQKKQQQQLKTRQQKQRQLIQEHKNKLMPLVKFLKKQGLLFKHARVGQNRVQYFRYDQFVRLREQKQQKINKNENLKQLFQNIQSQNWLIYFKRPNQSKSLKYPHTLQPTHQSDQNAKFCCFRFDTTISRKWLMFAVAIGALALVLFPVWPFTVKYAIWLISLYLLIFLVGLLLFRLVIYLICVVAGFNVWILPNLLGQYGFIQSFKPFIHAQRWQKSIFNILIRIGAFALIVYYGVQIYMDPTFLQSHLHLTKNTINDVHDWGVSKIKNQIKFSQRAITNLEDILNQTADVQDTQENIQNIGKQDNINQNIEVQQDNRKQNMQDKLNQQKQQEVENQL